MQSHTPLEDILAIANWAVNRTRAVVPYSSNLPDPKKLLSHRRIALWLGRVRGRTKDQRALIDEIFNWHIDLSPVSERYPLNTQELWLNSRREYVHFKKIPTLLQQLPNVHSDRKIYKNSLDTELRNMERIATKALKIGLGNCGDVSPYAQLLLMEYPKEGIEGLPPIKILVPILRVYFEVPNDHTFLVLNLKEVDESVILKDITTWNDDAVFCDAWTKEVYTKKQLLENKNEDEIAYLKMRFLGIKRESYNQYFIGEKFNEKVHTQEWKQKHSNSKKFWRPKHLRDVCERPQIPENLPPMREHLSPIQKSVKKMSNRGNGATLFTPTTQVTTTIASNDTETKKDIDMEASLKLLWS